MIFRCTHHVGTLASPKPDILGFGNAHTSVVAALTLRTFAPSEPTRFGSAMKIYKYIFAALTSLTFHVKHAIASVATGCLHTGMTEHEHVGSEGAQHFQNVGFIARFI